MKKRLVPLLWGLVAAQDGDLFVGSEIYTYLERWDVRGWIDTFVPIETRPWGREEAFTLLARLDTAEMGKGDEARYWRAYFQLQDSLPLRSKVRVIPSFLFPEGRDMLLAKTPWGSLFVGPIVFFSGGRDSSGLLFQNTRGLYLRARLARKVGIYMDVLETQATPPFFIMQRYNQYQTLWGETFVKPFRKGGVDYANTRGYITYSPIPAIRIKAGRDKAFWGPGFQSLFLSDYPPEYLYFHVRTCLGAWEYHNFFAQLIDYIPNKPDRWGDQPRKYAALHQLLWRPSKGVAVGVFESVMYNPWTPQGKRGIELTYWIPVIFYRTVEQALGSPDNAFLGFFFRANFLRHFQLYGQLNIDDYNFSKRKEGRGWWGDKYALQVGLKSFDVGIRTLDIQVEFNQVQPYTYSHLNVGAAWTHHGQFLAHPYGANLRELSGILRYQPLPGMTAEARVSYIWQGQNQMGQNWGAEPFQSNVNHVRDFGNHVLQGQLVKYTLFHSRVTYQPFMLPLYIEGEFFLRNVVRGGWLGLRWMLAPKVLRF
ncbi:MAG: hypothetical protein RMJ66_07055 [Bacteroidia bacterium]|nr:hypothetical protein [Bacteroidia bacterium]MDW8134811.1 hypothetical protein [Bacteroidia bacterium]